MIDLAGLLVERVVVHPIPRKEPKATIEQQTPLVLSEVLSPLNDNLRQYMMLRLRGSLQSVENAFDVVFSDTPPHQTSLDVRAHLLSEAHEEGMPESRDEAFVRLSRTLAERLFTAQPSQPPPSLFAVCGGSVGETPFLAVMKLEHERGVTAEEKQIGGRRTFEMTVEERLVLVAGTKVFKAALFSPVSKQDVIDHPADFVIDGRLSDRQNPFTTSGVADYFRAGLLGLRLKSEPRVVTEEVFKAIEKFVNTEIADPAERVAAERALLVEMASNKQMFSAQRYGESHLNPATRGQLLRSLRDQGLETRGFVKANELIANRLKMITLELEGKIRVIGPQEKFDDETIKVTTATEAPEALVTIRAPLRRAGSRGS